MSAVLPEFDLPGAVGAGVEVDETRAHASRHLEAPVSMPLTPVQRLSLSRERLRAVMFPPQPVASAPSTNRLEGWLASFKKLPGIEVVVEAAQAWWIRHPLRPVSSIAARAIQTALKPVAGKHPLLLVLIAAGAGMLLVSLRPWRWALRSALFAGLMPQVLARMVTRTLALTRRARRKGVQTRMIWGSSLLGKEVGPMIYEAFLPAALAENRFAAAPKPSVVGHGLDWIVEALEQQRKGVSARKLVVTL